jgi:ATP-dependent Lon protease
MDEEKPTIPKIIGASVDDDIRRRCLYQYDILQNLEPYTDDWLNTIRHINKMLEVNLMNEEHLDKLQKIKNQSSDMYRHSNFTSKLIDLDTDDKTKAVIYEKIDKFKNMSPEDSDYPIVMQWIEWALSLPYRRKSVPAITIIDNDNKIIRENINGFCSHLMAALDKKLYGLRHVKERFVEAILTRMTSPTSPKTNIALHGVQGLGKTVLAQTFAEVLGKPFQKMSLGGISDVAAFTGHAPVYKGAEPSVILSFMRRMGCCDGIIFMDELDKLGGTKASEKCQDALLHLTDYSTNSKYQDRYLEHIDHDLSQIMYIFALNEIVGINGPLLDRLEVITIKDYTLLEREEILKTRLLPDALQRVGINEQCVNLTKTCIDDILKITAECPGVRKIKEIVDVLACKIHTSSITSVLSCSNILKPDAHGVYKITSDIFDKLAITNLKGKESTKLTYFS